MKKQTNNTVPPVPIARLVRCVWRNFAASMIMNLILGVFLVAVCEVGGHPGIERSLAALIGLNMGWILGMAGLLFVARFDTDEWWLRIQQGRCRRLARTPCCAL